MINLFESFLENTTSGTEYYLSRDCYCEIVVEAIMRNLESYPVLSGEPAIFSHKTNEFYRQWVNVAGRIVIDVDSKLK